MYVYNHMSTQLTGYTWEALPAWFMPHDSGQALVVRQCFQWDVKARTRMCVLICSNGATEGASWTGSAQFIGIRLNTSVHCTSGMQASENMRSCTQRLPSRA